LHPAQHCLIHMLSERCLRFLAGSVLGLSRLRHGQSYGAKRKFRIVEEGDPKGLQSSKGVKAKKEQKIESQKLSPHIPGFMLLVFCLWHEIVRRTLAKTTSEIETVASYRKLLNFTAKRLPKMLIKKCLRKMMDNIAKTVASGGSRTEPD
jgi:hypothetical protein